MNPSLDDPSWKPPTRDPVDPAALMRIKDLQLRAKSVVDGFHNGLHRSPLHGFSVEFSEYRPFTDGDDPRTIDWKLFARSDRYYIKKFEDETNRRCYLAVDQSRSMTYGSIDYTKHDYASSLAATLAYYLMLQRDAVGMATFASEVTDWATARFRPGQLKRLLAMLERGSDGSSTNLVTPLTQLADTIGHRSLIIVISDFLAPLDALRAPLAFLRARRHDVMLMRILDPAELTLEWDRPAMLRDLESGRELYIDPAAARTRYVARFQEHASRLEQLAGQLGISLTTLTTNQPLERALFDLLSQQISRATRNGTNHPRTSTGSPKITRASTGGAR